MASITDTLIDSAIRNAAITAASTPIVAQNRTRAAAAVDAGYKAMETYDRWRPTLFAASAAGAAISFAMAARRRRVPEAWALYLTTGGLASVVAWFTRPAALRPAPAPLPPGATGPDSLGMALGWADRRANQLTTQHPGWEAVTWRRLASDLGWGTLPPYAEILLTTNSR